MEMTSQEEAEYRARSFAFAVQMVTADEGFTFDDLDSMIRAANTIYEFVRNGKVPETDD